MDFKCSKLRVLHSFRMIKLAKCGKGCVETEWWPFRFGRNLWIFHVGIVLYEQIFTKVPFLLQQHHLNELFLMSSQWLHVNEIQWFVLGTNWLIKAHLPITEVKFDSVLGELPMKWRSKHVAARSQISDEVWCLKRGIAAMQGPWGGKSQSNIIKFSSAMLYRSTTNQMYPSLGFRFTSEYLHYGQVVQWADMFVHY